MRAVANRSAALKGASLATNTEGHGIRASADDSALLDALPIAAGVFGIREDQLWVHALNQRFFELAGCGADPAKFAELFHHYSDSSSGQFVQAYLTDRSAAADELDLVEGEGPQKRFLKLKLAPLEADSKGAPRCLLSVVDRTVEVQAENNLRAEMLRDSLTGLPNRLSFTETVESRGADPRERDHAVLVVDMLRFSRINESMGSLAGDELLITFARRLMSALRGGDILARTGAMSSEYWSG
jgi:predicted signal transduction protein with EAL and GGDEF domain